MISFLSIVPIHHSNDRSKEKSNQHTDSNLNLKIKTQLQDASSSASLVNSTTHNPQNFPPFPSAPFGFQETKQKPNNHFPIT
ncbi:unnamed protein product [Prunus brigantina]